MLSFMYNCHKTATNGVFYEVSTMELDEMNSQLGGFY